ncbi:MAG: hypothetical protein IPI88_15725, partial [Chitinophagaceae bacterium]|nr:hypothetical protein [Chitinophagaceae bacterium]
KQFSLTCFDRSTSFFRNEEAEELKERPWYKILSGVKEKSQGISCLEIAQNILEMPLNRTLDSLMLNESSRPD